MNVSICILNIYERIFVYLYVDVLLLDKILLNCSFNACCSFLGCLLINSFIKLIIELYTSNCLSVIRYSSIDVTSYRLVGKLYQNTKPDSNIKQKNDILNTEYRTEWHEKYI